MGDAVDGLGATEVVGDVGEDDGEGPVPLAGAAGDDVAQLGAAVEGPAGGNDVEGFAAPGAGDGETELGLEPLRLLRLACGAVRQCVGAELVGLGEGSLAGVDRRQPHRRSACGELDVHLVSPGGRLTEMLPAVVCGERLELRRWRVDDVGALMAAISVSLDELRVWMPWARAMPTAEVERALIDASSARFDRGEDFEYFLFELGTGELVGAAALHVRKPERVEIGYWVRSDRHRRGYATEAARALTSSAFEHIPSVGVVEISMDKANRASAGVPSKLGYELVGEVDRDVVTPGHTGRGLVWRTTRAAWRA